MGRVRPARERAGGTGRGWGGTGRWLVRHKLVGAAAVWGVVLALAFPPFGWWPLAAVAVAGLTALVRGRRLRVAAGYGFAFGLGFFLVLLDWVRVLGWAPTVGLAAVEAAYLAAMAVGLALVWRLPGWPVWTACVWVAQEAVRDRWPFGGFPWGRLAFSQSSSVLTPLAAVGGAPLLTFAVALAGAGLVWLVTGVRRRRVGTALAAAACVALPAVGAAAVPVPNTGSRSLTVAAVQGNVPREGLDYLGQGAAVLDNHVAETLRLAAEARAGTVPEPQVVIWPENASDLDPYTDLAANEAIEGAVRAVGVPVLVGAVVQGPVPDHLSNMGIVWSPVTGPGATYTKRHLVPFGEYVPFRSELEGWITELRRVPEDFAPGHTVGVLQLGPARVGDVICFEVADDGLVRQAVTGGGQLLVVQTNNATYGGTAQPAQQLAIEQLRAVEHGRAVVVAATSGISAIVDPDGTVVAQTAQFTPAVLVDQVPLRDGETLSDRLGGVPEEVGAGLGLAAAALAGAGAWRERRRRGRDEAAVQGAEPAAPEPAGVRVFVSGGADAPEGRIGEERAARDGAGEPGA